MLKPTEKLARECAKSNCDYYKDCEQEEDLRCLDCYKKGHFGNSFEDIFIIFLQDEEIKQLKKQLKNECNNKTRPSI